LPEFDGYEKKVNGKEGDDGEKTTTIANADLQTLCTYCGLDSDLTLRLLLHYEVRLMGIGNFYQIFRNLLMMATRVLAESEYDGFLVNRPYLNMLGVKYKDLIAESDVALRAHPKIRKFERGFNELRVNKYVAALEAEKEGATDARIANIKQRIVNIRMGIISNKKESKLFEKLNMNSVQQMIEFLYVSKAGLRLPVLDKTETGNPSTGEETLLKLVDRDKSGFLTELLNLRGLSKLNSTYIVGMKEVLSENDRVHCSYLLHGTVTGRLSSKSPNMQNIPRVTTNADIKPMFIAPPGYYLLEVDYSQAELRVVAELSGDKTMIMYFKNGYNIHCATAAGMVNMSYEEFYPMTKDENHPRHEWATKMKKKAKCYSPDTEVLTQGGWVKLIKYEGENLIQYWPETGKCDFTKPTHWGKTLSESNYLYQDRNVSLNVTSDHWQPFITRNGKYIREKFKDLVGKNGYIPSSAYCPDNKGYLTEEYTRFLAMFAADGNIKKNGVIRFGFKKERKIIRCEKLLHELGLDFTRSERGGVTKFYIPKQTGSYWVLDFITREKELSWECLTTINGKIYLDESKYWDATQDERWTKETCRFFSRVEQTVDVMQALGSIWGIRCVKHTNKNGMSFRLAYNPGGCTKSRVNLTNAKKLTSPTWMYGVTVPSENLIIRHQGRVSCSGNTYNFGVLYGQTAKKLAVTISAASGEPPNEKEAQKGLDKWFKTFPGVKKWIDRQQKIAKRDGFVYSIFGRKRRLPNIYSDKWGIMLEAQRQSVNAPIQGAASDFTQLTSIVVREMKLTGKLPFYMQQVYTVHDSIGYIVKPEHVNDVAKKIVEVGADPDTQTWFGFRMKEVRMKLSCELGLNWGSYHEHDSRIDYVEKYKEDIKLLNK